MGGEKGRRREEKASGREGEKASGKTGLDAQVTQVAPVSPEGGGWRSRQGAGNW